MDLLVKADPRYFKWLVALLAPALLIIALIALSHELRQYHFADIQAALERLPSWRLVVAVALTLTSYAVLTLYDRLGLAYAGRRLAQGRVVLASFCAYVFSYNIGFSVLGGAAVRYRLYTLWGLSALEITRLVLAGTTWLGFLAFKHVEYSNENGKLAQAVGEAAHQWQIEQLQAEEGRLDEVFRSITMPDTAKEAA